MNLELIKDLGFKNLNSIRKDTGKQDRKAYGLYKCYCGNEFEAFISSVKSGNTKSCGCYKKKILIALNTTHGLKYHRLYKIWNGMMQRCHNKKAEYYKDYGARGISVCNEWHNIENFINDMYPSYEEGLSIDRINNDLGYSKDNCRWASKSIQTQNTRKIRINNTSGYRGVCWNKQRQKWKAYISISNKRICLGHFEDKNEAAKTYDYYILSNNLEHTKNFS